MFRRFAAFTLSFLLAFPAAAQQTPATNQNSGAASTTEGAALLDGTPVRLRLSRNLSSADATTGETVDFEVLEEVKVGETVVIPKGGLAIGTVTDAEHKKRMGRGGKLDVTIDYVRLVDGEKAALRAVREGKGGGHTGAMTAGIVATSLVVWPAAPFFLFMHGKDITIPKGTPITAYVNGDFPLDKTKIEAASHTAATPAPAATPVSASKAAEPATLAAATTAAPATVPASTAAPTVTGSEITLNVASTPLGADIEIDGAFVGTTPSSIGVQSGDHDVKITKSGYRAWQRKLRVTTGSVQIAAELEKEAPEAGQAK